VSDSPEQVRLQVLLAVENFIATEVGACERIIEMMSFRRVNAGIFRREHSLRQLIAQPACVQAPDVYDGISAL